MNSFTYKPRKVFYEFLVRKGIGPTGDYVDAGIYWVNKYIPALEVRADKIWSLMRDGTLREIRPDPGTVSEETLSWLNLKATYLGWFD